MDAVALLENQNKDETSIVASSFHLADKCKDNMLLTFKKGKKRGETTRFESIDKHFTWKKGELTCVTGFPNHGKTELVMQLMLAKAIHDNWRWSVYSPENFPVDEIYDTLIHAYIGKTTDPHYSGQMTYADYLKGIDFVKGHFFCFYPQLDHTFEAVSDCHEYAVKNFKVDGCLTDPFNAIDQDATIRDDHFIRDKLNKAGRFARKYNICNVITAHPSGEVRRKEDGSFPVPDQYNLAGGRMWNNKCDNILAVHRPNYHKDKSDSLVEFHSHKIKKQKLVGLPGSVCLDFRRVTNRYHEMNGNSPLQIIEIDKF